MRAFFLVAVLLLSACPPTVSDPPGSGFLDILVQVDDPDPGSPIEGVGLVITRVDAVIVPTGTTEEEVLTLSDQAAELSLPRMSFGIPTFVVRALVPTGEVRQLRFVLAVGFAQVEGESHALTFEVIVPSGQETGIKGVPRHDASIEIFDGQTTHALTTIDLPTQLHSPPGTGLSLKPTSQLGVLNRATISDGLTDGDTITSSMASSFRETGVRVERAKIFNSTTGTTRDVVIDQDGNPRDYDEVVAAENAAFRSLHGAMVPALVSTSADLPADAPMIITALVHVPDAHPFVPPDPFGDLDAAYAEYMAQIEQLHKPYVDAAVAQIEAAGAQVLQRSDRTAEIQVAAPASSVRTTLAFIPGIDAMDESRTPTNLAVNSAHDLVEDSVVPYYLSVPRAQAQAVRMLFDERACADLTRPTFDSSVHEPCETGGGPPISVEPDDLDHATGVVSVAAGYFLGSPSGPAGAYLATLRPGSSTSLSPYLNDHPNVLQSERRRELESRSDGR